MSVHFGSPSQNVLKLILKSPRFGSILGSTLASEIWDVNVEDNLDVCFLFILFWYSYTRTVQYIPILVVPHPIGISLFHFWFYTSDFCYPLIQHSTQACQIGLNWTRLALNGIKFNQLFRIFGLKTFTLYDEMVGLFCLIWPKVWADQVWFGLNCHPCLYYHECSVTVSIYILYLKPEIVSLV